MNRYLEDLVTRYPALAPQAGSILTAYEAIRDAFAGGNRLYIAGNGGSAADALHIAGELLKPFMLERPSGGELKEKLTGLFGKTEGEYMSSCLRGGLPAFALPGWTSFETAYCNDIDADMVFAQQLYAVGEPGDVFLGISTSGNAKNILNAMKAAKALGIKSAGLTGKDGGQMKDLADICINVGREKVYEIQELHMPVYHALCLMLEDHFFGRTAV